MPSTQPRTKRRLRIGRVLVLAVLAGLIGGQDSCLPDPEPAFPRYPMALDCVVGGNQLYLPIDIVGDSDRFMVALTGAIVDTTVTAEVPVAAFCALDAAGYTQFDLAFAAIDVSVTNATVPDPPQVTLTASGLPFAGIDIADACAGTLGPVVDIDFGTVTGPVWADGDWTVKLLVTLEGIDIGLANVFTTASPGVPIPSMQLLDLCDPTDKSVPPNGTTDDPEDSPRIAVDVGSDGTFDRLVTDDDQVTFNVNGFCVGYKCDDFNDCTIDTCDLQAKWCYYDNEPDGTSCDFGGQAGACSVGACVAICDTVDCDDGNECTVDSCDPADGTCTGQPVPDDTPCDGGAGVCRSGACAFPIDSTPQTKTITLACTNNVTPDAPIFLPFDLTVTPSVSGPDISAVLGGVVELSEWWLDVPQGVVPGGVTQANVLDIAATVHVRSGATGADVTLTTAPIPSVCLIPSGASCDPANDGPSVPGARPNTDCIPTGTFNPCMANVPLPISTDCSPGGTCDLLGKAFGGYGSGYGQCENNGFCISGPLLLPLVAQVASYTPDGSGTVFFGWDDTATGASLNGDGTWALPPSAFADPTGPNGIRVNMQGLALGLECTMAVDSGGPTGVGVPDASSPTPNSALMAFTTDP